MWNRSPAVKTYVCAFGVYGKTFTYLVWISLPERAFLWSYWEPAPPKQKVDQTFLELTCWSNLQPMTDKSEEVSQLPREREERVQIPRDGTEVETLLWTESYPSKNSHGEAITTTATAFGDGAFAVHQVWVMSYGWGPRDGISDLIHTLENSLPISEWAGPCEAFPAWTPTHDLHPHFYL